jgi:hypothetical protein
MKYIKYILPLFFIPSLSFADPVQTVDAGFATATVAFGSITASYATALTNTATAPVQPKRYRLCIFTNSTNQSIAWDDGTTAILGEQLPGTMMALDFGANGRDIRTSIRLKYLSAPASGNATINCMY